MFIAGYSVISIKYGNTRDPVSLDRTVAVNVVDPNLNPSFFMNKTEKITFVDKKN
jgi:hypothetical protein